MDNASSIDTLLIHAGEPRPRVQGAVSFPVFQSSTYEYGDVADSYDAVRYIRMNNTPNHLVLHDKMAAIEGAEAALVTGSGMAAISAAMFSALPPGSHLLAQRCLYGGTHSFVTQDLAALGFSYDFIDLNDPDSWKQKLKAETKAIYVESMTNPLLEVGELAAVVEFSRAHGLVSMIDNTFPSPINFRPAEHGFDLSLHSCSKYMNGHSDIVAGAVIGKADRVAAAAHRLLHLGGTLDPHACFLLQRGMKTLALRVRHQNASALKLARALEAHPAVARVNHPGLESHRDHARARALFDGFGGMLSLELKAGVDAADRMMRSLRIPIIAPSLGGVETLITRPATTSHASLSRVERESAGISDGLVRVSVGIEDADELVADFERALGTA